MITSSELQADKLLEVHLDDLVSLSKRYSVPYFSKFLDERQVYLTKQRFTGRVDCNVWMWGGYEGALRQLCCIFPEWMEPDAGMVPIVCLTFRYRESDCLTHRDFLGSFMSKGIVRETIGDIVTGCGITQVLVTDVVAPLLKEITKVGRCGVKATDNESFIMKPSQNFREISGTVSSLRIDTVTALGIRESREKTVGLLKKGKIELNYCEVVSPSEEVDVGDIITVRGYGKFRLKTVTGLSRKGRLHILIEQYH